ncbi:MAG TPA: histidine triad nucleotide-binding protein [Spongiibacteraceae bacterium]|jgi:histidine triad (HIT) family protein
MTDCLFCNIAAKRIPATAVYEDEHVFAFRDVSPQAPVHILIIPQRHLTTLNETQPDDAVLLGQMIFTAQQLAKTEGIAESGYRLVMNCNRDGGQTVYHIHLHLLGGRGMHWPPG